MKYFYIAGILSALALLIVLGWSRLQNGGRPALSTAGSSEGGNGAGGLEELTVSEPYSASTSPTGADGTSTGGQSGTTQAETKPVTPVTLETSLGNITIELYTGTMPVTAGNFLKLAREGFYNGVQFHRVIDGFMIQGGDPLTKDASMRARWGTGGPGYQIPDEFGPRYSNTPGTISMANAGPNTGGSQFFINTAANTFLDGKHPVFGKVTAGMDVVGAISKTPTGTGDVPLTPVVIKRIVVE